MKIILNHLSFFYKHIHHDVDLFPDGVSFFLEQLKQVIPCHQLVLYTKKLVVDSKNNCLPQEFLFAYSLTQKHRRFCQAKYYRCSWIADERAAFEILFKLGSIAKDLFG